MKPRDKVPYAGKPKHYSGPRVAQPPKRLTNARRWLAKQAVLKPSP